MKETSTILTVEELFRKMRNEFGETSEEERKVEMLRMLEQGGRTCDEYMQEFKKLARESRYERHSLIEEFKRGLNGAIRRKLAEAENPPTTIGEWQERTVRLDRNQRQSRVEERIMGRNVVYPGGNAQPRGSMGGGSHGGRGGQITWRNGGPSQSYKGGGQNHQERVGQPGPSRDPNTIEVDRQTGGDRTCYVCGKWGHMAKNCWQRKDW